MRVVHVVSAVGTYGGERFVPALVAAQRRAGIDAMVATLYDSPAASVSDLPTYSAGRGYAGRAKGGGFLFFFRLVGFLRKSHPDVVHTHLAHAKLWGRLAALAAGAGCIVHTEHANAFHDSLPKRFLARVLHRRTAVIVALSEAQRERILRHEGPEPERVVVVPNGIEIAPSSPMTPRDRARRRAVLGVPKGASMILAVGRLDAVKGYDLALEALALLPQQTHLVVVGDGALRDALLARGEALGVSARLHLLGYRDDVTDLLAASDLLLNTSRSEAMPLSILEALCAGVPVVATPWPGARELLGDERVTETWSAQAVAACVRRVLLEPRSATEASLEACRAGFSIDLTAQRYAALYAAALAGTGAPRATGRKSLVAPGGSG